MLDCLTTLGQKIKFAAIPGSGKVVADGTNQQLYQVPTGTVGMYPRDNMIFKGWYLHAPWFLKLLSDDTPPYLNLVVANVARTIFTYTGLTFPLINSDLINSYDYYLEWPFLGDPLQPRLNFNYTWHIVFDVSQTPACYVNADLYYSLGCYISHTHVMS